MAIIQQVEMKSKKIKALYAVIFAFLSIGLFVNFLPLIMMFLGTFKTNNELQSAVPVIFPAKWSFESYKLAFSNFNILHNVYNTVFYCGMSIICQTITSTMAAFALSRINMKGKSLFYTIFIGTSMFTATALLFPTYILLTKCGMIGNKMSLILIYSGWGYAIILYKNFFDSIPKDLFEAAEIDGAGIFQQIIRIMVPLSKPIFAVNILSTFMAVYNDFLLPTMIYPDENDWSLMMRIFMMDKSGNIEPRIMYVLLFVTTIPSIVFYLFAQKTLVQGVASTGIKG